ncbi:hypothetical protein KVR01_006944 [Diaporthe batatas]|uniref:uncharacterized protein n=1 Tax=Diaporthe batatas TaxID=748121 RepID=UPI001D03DB64|nr:uncharacterized protein KVR01_006944 [Diaporthe batatas]KAG8163647.1 hypothetical protein KVR01_006944 [Diaporthe batatas]
MASPGKKAVVLHIGDPVKYNPDTYAALSSAYDVIRPSAAERERPEFMRALRERRWGDFAAIFRPFWSTGGEMGRWDAELIALLPASCRVFASAGAGFDWADTRLLGERAAEAVADFAVALVISTFRHLPWGIAAATVPHLLGGSAAAEAAEAAFRFSHTHEVYHSHNLRGHALGLVGLGRIGSLVAAKLGNPSMGMVLHYHDIVRRPAADEARLGLTYHPTLASLLAASDCAVLCTPASADGTPLISREALAALKPGARFVNVARGSLVDEDALADALESGRVGAAALDVFADEPRISPRLLAFAGPQQVAAAGAQGGRVGPDGGAVNPGRVLLTCHNAGGTVETHVGFEELAMRNIMAVLGGRGAITPVNMHFLNRKDSKL